MTRGARSYAHLPLLAVLLVAGAAPAWALIGDTSGPFGLDGSIRTIPVLIDTRSLDGVARDRLDELVQTLLRLDAAGSPLHTWTYEIQVVQSYTYTSTRIDTALFIPSLSTGSGAVRYRALDATATWLSEAHNTATFWVDRFNVKLAVPRADITVGRQAINFGKTYFWNPLDVFLPFDPNQFDRDYKPGVDALRIDVPLGSFSGVNLVGAVGGEITAARTFADGDEFWHASWYGSALLARVFTNLRGWDLSAQGGKIYGGGQLGGGLVGEIGPLETRAEATYFWAQDSDPLPPPIYGHLVANNALAVVGVGHRFESSFTVESEFFYNGAGDPDNLPLALLRLETGAALNLGRELSGLLVSYEILPILLGQMTGLYSWSDGSFELQPTLSLSTSDNSEWLLGLTFNTGDRPTAAVPLPQLNSEFGSYPNFFFTEFKWYF